MALHVPGSIKTDQAQVPVVQAAMPKVNHFEAACIMPLIWLRICRAGRGSTLILGRRWCGKLRTERVLHDIG